MEDIQNVLELVRDRLNGFLRESLQVTEDVAVLSNLREADGTQPPFVENRLVLSLAKIEQSTSNSVPVRGVPRVSTNLYLLILANITGERYPTGLSMISRVIGFMQDNPVLNHASLPGLDATIESLSFEFVDLDASQWSLYLEMAGTTYLPAAMYRVRIAPHR
jgi:Pvc16 N-terminal domain